MIFRFLLLSDEVANFKREIQISPEATFLDFHKAILESTGYDKNQMYSFFICNDDWSKETEITLIEMDTSSEEDSYIMENTVLEELIKDEHQKLLYVFDVMSERMFFIELREIITGKDLKSPICSKSVGNPPEQLIDYEQLAKNITSTSDLDDDFYGDEEYDEEDLEGLDETSLDDLADRY
ncbi:MAG: plasmid pRiA4b ORF-3 family protein [Tannerella sp.]|jgi:hypothetical protein|nr:plasmid pRiA4b ORF-3 family protein [Tannerella sp.]